MQHFESAPFILLEAMPQIRGCCATASFVDCRPASTMRQVDLMFAKDCLEKEPASIEPPSCLIGLTRNNGGARSNELPGSLLPKSGGESNRIMLEASVLASSMDCNGQPLTWIKLDWPTMSKHTSDFGGIHANHRSVVRCLNEAPRPQHGILICPDVLLPLLWKGCIMVLALPNQMLHRDLNIAQRAHDLLACSMGAKRTLGPSINSSSGCPFELPHHSMIDHPVGSSHHRKAVFKLLYAPCSLQLLLSKKLPVQVRPRMFQIELM